MDNRVHVPDQGFHELAVLDLADSGRVGAGLAVEASDAPLLRKTRGDCCPDVT
jgi:hypothetical protein